MSKPKILLQLDTDARPSVFDAVVAIDAGVEHLLPQANVTAGNVRDLVYGCIFTRGPQDLCRTAIFIGGSDVATGEAVVRQIERTFLGPLRVSVLMDCNGANTTAAAAVLAARKHVPLTDAETLVLGATGPVGQRVVRLLAGQGARVRVASRSLARAEAVCEAVRARCPQAQLTPAACESPALAAALAEGAALVVAAGAAGVELLSAEGLRAARSVRVAIDLNAVPPAGVGGIDAQDKARDREGVICYGAIGVGGLKMKIHKAAVARLFEPGPAVLDAEEVLQIGLELA